MDSVLHGDRIGYVGSAILYDEQPVTFAQSWRQRLRWSKGFLQVFRYYGPALVRRAIQERDFSSIDLTLFICPFTVLAIIRVLLGHHLRRLRVHLMVEPGRRVVQLDARRRFVDGVHDGAGGAHDGGGTQADWRFEP